MKFCWKTAFKAVAGVVLTFLVGIVSTHAQEEIGSHDTLGHHPDAEFQLARVKYKTVGGGGSHGYFQPWWAIDYPLADQHFLEALRRMTMLEVAEDSRHLELTDDRIFDYPFL